ncbi:MAG TPA: hypothetical protein VGQ18_08360 [Gemmatimonadales bacterium]|jgi:hypothetical protein|nr:hypothetical protein [Gemmatimonadales bacterium]
MRRSTLFLVLALLAAGCNRERSDADARALAVRALRGALAYPQSTLVNLSAGTDAAELTFTSGAAAADVAQWYRRALTANGWEVKSDQTGRDGAIAMYAEQGPRPLWLTVRPNVGGPGSTYTMIGAIVAGDSIK